MQNTKIHRAWRSRMGSHSNVKVYDAATGNLKRLESTTGKVLAEARRTEQGVILVTDKRGRMFDPFFHQNRPSLARNTLYFFNPELDAQMQLAEVYAERYKIDGVVGLNTLLLIGKIDDTARGGSL